MTAHSRCEVYWRMPGASEVLSGGDHMHNRSAEHPRIYRVARNKLTWGTRWIESAGEQPYPNPI